MKSKYIINMTIDIRFKLSMEFDDEYEFNEYLKWLKENPGEVILNTFDVDEIGEAVAEEIATGDFKIKIDKIVK